MKGFGYSHGVSKASSFFVILFLLSMVWAFLPAAVKAQTSTATLNGTVRDPSGAVVPAATVTLTNIDTGVQRVTETTGTGNYAILNIPVGRYTVEVTKGGFATTKEEELTLSVNQTATRDFNLSLGAATETVTVQAVGAEIETSTAELGTVISELEVTNLPLNGRNFTQLLSLTPGVSPISVAQNRGGFGANPVGTFTFPAINGQQNRSNMFTLDGVNNQGSFVNTYSVPPIIDAIQEFKVQTHNDGAEFGQVTGGIVNIVTKSGTNEFHGSAWEFLRNDVLDARSPFLDDVSALRFNQFGGVGGGPIVKNKTFFFGSYQGFRERRASQSLVLVPTPQQLAGDLSGLGVDIFDPFSTQEVPDPSDPTKTIFIRDQFPGNVIPANRIDPNQVAWAQAVYPAPQQTGIAGVNHINTRSRSNRQDDWGFKIDHHISSKDSVWFRFNKAKQTGLTPAAIATASVTREYEARNWGVNYVRTLSPTSVLQVQVGRNYATSFNQEGYESLVDEDVIALIGIQNNTACGFRDVSGVIDTDCILPTLSLEGFANAPDTGLNNTVMSDVWQVKANYSKIRGNHTFKFGGEVNTNDEDAGVITSLGVGFAAQQTFDPQTPGTGAGLASFLLGVPDNSSLRNTLESVFNGYVNGLYFQDSWKATPKLTLNFGLRWDITMIPEYGSDAQGNAEVGSLDLINGQYILQRDIPSCADRGTAPCIPGGIASQSNVIVDPRGKIYHDQYDNWQPRFGFAYRVSDSTAIRGSFNIFFDNWSGILQISRNYQDTWPAVVARLEQNLNLPTSTQLTPTTTVVDPLRFGTDPNVLPEATPFDQVFWFADPDYENAYSEQWSFGIQHQLTKDTMVDLNYVGSHGSRLNLGGFYNTARTPNPSAVDESDRPFPFISPTFYDRSWGRSNYHAFQFRLDRKFTSGLSYLISYTWSKSLDMGCSGWFGVEGCNIQDPYNFNNDWGPSGYDLTHIFSGNWIYQLPFGTGKKFQTGNKVLDYLVGPWQVNGITTFTSGQVHGVGISGDHANTGNANCCNTLGGAYERLNLAPGGNPKLDNPTPAQWFDPNAFDTPPFGTFGNLSRHSLRGDGFANLDFSIFREFPLQETKRLEFRFEMFNATNTPTFNLPGGNINDLETYGRVFSTRSIERQLQFGLKFYF